jgi:hypothetical protein
VQQTTQFHNFGENLGRDILRTKRNDAGLLAVRVGLDVKLNSA